MVAMSVIIMLVSKMLGHQKCPNNKQENLCLHVCLSEGGLGDEKKKKTEGEVERGGERREMERREGECLGSIKSR